MSAKQADGATLRDHLQSLWRQNGYAEDKKPWQLEPISCPEELRYLWDYFKSMNARRTSNGFGPNPIPNEGVMAWAQRRNFVLDPLENAAIDALEAVYLQFANRKESPNG